MAMTTHHNLGANWELEWQHPGRHGSTIRPEQMIFDRTDVGLAEPIVLEADSIARLRQFFREN